jgi:hypothetical protein
LVFSIKKYFTITTKSIYKGLDNNHLTKGVFKMATKYYTKSELIRLNNKSIKENRNQCLNTQTLKNLNPKFIYPVSMTLNHGKGNIIRTIIILDEKGNRGMLDINAKDFNKLKSIETLKGGLNVN